MFLVYEKICNENIFTFSMLCRLKRKSRAKMREAIQNDEHQRMALRLAVGSNRILILAKCRPHYPFNSSVSLFKSL